VVMLIMSSVCAGCVAEAAKSPSACRFSPDAVLSPTPGYLFAPQTIYRLDLDQMGGLRPVETVTARIAVRPQYLTRTKGHKRSWKQSPHLRKSPIS
jgi:hypothetical protein